MLSRVTSLVLMMVSAACSNVTSRGIPCGGTRQVSATAILPDTGLGAGGEASVTFRESEPNRERDETAVYVWTFPPSGTAFADAPPRVRVVTDDGRVFLDLPSWAAYQGSWYVRQAVVDGPVRDEIVAAFQAGIVMVEYSTTQPVPKVTRVRPEVHFAGRTERLRCV